MISLCAVLALGSGFLIVRDLSQYAESAGTYDGLAEHVEVPGRTGEPEEPGQRKKQAGRIPVRSSLLLTLKPSGKTGRTSSDGSTFLIRPLTTR